MEIKTIELTIEEEIVLAALCVYYLSKFNSVDDTENRYQFIYDSLTSVLDKLNK
jgi:hypothetical protein